MPSLLVALIEGMFQSFVSMQSVSERYEQPTGVLRVEKWEVPPLGWYKLNMDAAVDIANGRVGYGVVICNSDGHVMAVRVDQSVFSDDVDIAKAEALCFAV